MAVNQKQEFVLTATGDTMITRNILAYEGVADEFDRLLDHMRSADTTIANLETAVHSYESPPADVSGTIMQTPPDVLDDLIGMGCDMVTAGNNHIDDYGWGGLRSAIEALSSRGLTYAGIGENLFEARQPGYFESAAGRVGLISTTTNIQRGGAAGEQSAALRGRPGVNPLRLSTTHYVEERFLEDLKAISEHVGYEAIKQQEVEHGYEHIDSPEDELFHFGDMRFKPAATSEDVRIDFEANPDDMDDICGYVDEADATCDWVVVGLHCHKGVNGMGHTEETPEFLVETARQFVDAGADAVIGTGTKVIRGIEIYDGKPIFHSLGQFVDQRRSVTRFPPQMYRRWGIEDFTKPGTLYETRFRTEDGKPRGQLADSEYWETFLPVCTFDESGALAACEIHPVTLQHSARSTQRGIPVLATGSEADRILDRLTRLSADLGTTVERDGEVARIEP